MSGRIHKLPLDELAEKLGLKGDIALGSVPPVLNLVHDPVGNLVARALQRVGVDDELVESTHAGNGTIILDVVHATVPAGVRRVVLQVIAFHDDGAPHDLMLGLRHQPSGNRLWYGRLLGASSGQPAFLESDRAMVLGPGFSVEIFLQGATVFAAGDTLTIRSHFVDLPL